MVPLHTVVHTPDIAGYLSEWSYLGIFIWFTIFDFIAPFPDEISLLTLGYLASIGSFNPFIAGAIAFISFVSTDSLSFLLVRKGKSLFFGGLKKAKEHSFRGYVAKRLEKNLPGTIITISFIPRMRIWGPIVVGSSKTPYRKFIIFDLIGVGLFTAVYTALGYFFGTNFSSIFKHLKDYEGGIFVALLLVFGLLLVYISGRIEERERHA